MRLLFDQMLSPDLVRFLAEAFPDSAHVHAFGMDTDGDTVVRDFAGAHGFTIVTKDIDHELLCARFGWPPKVIKITTGNCSTELVRSVLLAHRAALLEFEHANRGIYWIALD